MVRDIYDLRMAQWEGVPKPDRSRTAGEWLEMVRDAERRGEPLSAFDLAGQGLEEHPGDVELGYRAVLALARSGSTAQAAREFEELSLSAVESEDVGALEARIRKDFALAASGKERRQLAAKAAAAYLSIRARSQGYFPTINAATLTLVAGDRAEARRLAQESLRLVASSGDTGYFAAATEAEAYLLLGNVDGVRTALERAKGLQDGDYGALSTTRRQLRLICNEAGIDLEILSTLAGPAVAHYCGHLISPAGRPGRFTAVCEAEVTARISRAVDDRPVAFAYGSLANGGDTLWAEALLSRGCELHVILPFALEEFLDTSVAPAGTEWVRRFHRCLSAATSVSYATEDAYLGDDVLYRYCAELAMGLALLRARYLDAEVHQLALWDGTAATGIAGTAADVASWRSTGHDAIVVSPDCAGGLSVPRVMGADGAEPTVTVRRPRRVIRAMLIGDIRGFSKLSDDQLPAFSDLVLGAFAKVLSGYVGEVDYTNTWGDALFAVLSCAQIAARCAVDLQDAMGSLDLDGAGLPSHLAFRLSGHIGPVFPIEDPVLGRSSFIGSHVNRTARIEPVTPTGAVYVTEAFAAALVVSGDADIGCDYIGHLPAAKDYGRLRMYRIWRRASEGTSPRTVSSPWYL